MLTVARERPQAVYEPHHFINQQRFSAVPSSPVYPRIKNILFATDFSQCSACALESLRDFAELEGATIDVVHVVPPRRDELEPLPGLSGLHTVHSRVPLFLQKHPITNVPYEVWTAHGPIGDTLISLARREKIDMIALGAHGHRKGAPGLGVVADQIVSGSPFPVFTAGEQQRPHGTGRMQRVLFATDFSDDSLRALPYAVCFAKKTGAELLLVYVDTTEASADYLVEAAYEGKLLNLVPHESGLHNVEPVVAIGPVWKGIVDAATEHNADMIVMGFPMQTAEHSCKIHARAPCPVLSV
jgi:nucleotide-binding universal stress UspA family protein